VRANYQPIFDYVPLITACLCGWVVLGCVGSVDVGQALGWYRCVSAQYVNCVDFWHVPRGADRRPCFGVAVDCCAADPAAEQLNCRTIMCCGSGLRLESDACGGTTWTSLVCSSLRLP
jgi:hypothetical protein